MPPFSPMPASTKAEAEGGGGISLLVFNKGTQLLQGYLKAR